MLLAIDIGNTNISCGIFNNNAIKKIFDIPSKQYSLNKFRKKIGPLKITDTLICSVVPKLTNAVKKDLTGMLGKRPYIIGKDAQVPIKNRYRNPNQVGQDRLVNAYAGLIFYGAPLIVIDSGTALTFDVISKQGAYLGGLILPGLGVSLAALNEKTALLPRIKLQYPKELIGTNTISSILSGVVIGAGVLASGLASRIKRKIGKHTQIIGTGGSISLVKKYSDISIKIDRNLTLKGLSLIYENEIKNRNF
ncbi:MAG: type III pantothenate kinase [Candidatus Omnitrophota bacterium]|nr:type III pantothenate kinase [Candidatus Omnitrophota bacterium]